MTTSGLSLDAGMRYLFELKPAGAAPLAAGTLVLLDGNGQVIEWDAPAGGAAAAISYVAPVTGTYWLVATNALQADLNTGSASGTYEIKASPLSLDDHADLPGQGIGWRSIPRSRRPPACSSLGPRLPMHWAASAMTLRMAAAVTACKAARATTSCWAATASTPRSSPPHG